MEKGHKIYVREVKLRRPELSKEVIEKMEGATSKSEAKRILKDHLQSNIRRD